MTFLFHHYYEGIINVSLRAKKIKLFLNLNCSDGRITYDS